MADIFVYWRRILQTNLYKESDCLGLFGVALSIILLIGLIYRHVNLIPATLLGVIVFTVYPIFLATFQQANLPRKLIPACIMSSSCTVPLSMLPGGAQLNNIIPTLYLGTTPMAAFSSGLFASIATTLFLTLYFRHVFDKSRQKNEGFIVTPEIKERISQFDKETHIQPGLSVLPLLLILLLINDFQMDLSYAVFAGTALAFCIGHKNLPHKLRTINEGMSKVGNATIITSVSVAFGGAILACPSTQRLLQWILELPIPPIISLSLAASFAGILTGNGGGGADVAMQLLAQPYMALGINPENLHRVTAIATAGFSCLPNNGMLIKVMDTCGFTAKQSYKYIFISTVIGSCIGLAVMLLLVCYRR